MATVILTGRGGCGKTRNSKRLAEALGCKSIVDGWSRGDKIVADALHLTNEFSLNIPEGVEFIEFDVACKIAGINQDNRTMQDNTFLDCPAQLT